ncbi:unnamed protein product [Phaeothamnion confervicola]
MRLGSAASAAAVAAAARQAGQPLQKLAHSEATAALCWMPGHAHVLATGTIKYARLWDLRGRGVVHASWAAHPRVTGVAASALSPHLLATYSDATQEPVKVWDVRKLGSTGNPMPVATAVWSPVRAGVLATVLNDENVVHLWDLSSPGARTVQVPYSVQAAAGPIAHVSWQPVGARLARAAGAPQPSAAEVNAAAASPNRLLISTTLGQLQDTTLGDFAPLAVSATGEVVFARGSLTLALPSAAGSAAAVMAAAAAAAAATASSLQLLDMEEIMRKRTQAGYSMDIGENQQLLADELDAATVDDGVGGGSGNSGGGNSVADLTALWRLWDWVDRIEQLRGETEMAATGGSGAIGAPSTGLGTAAYDELFPVNPADAGVEALLAFDSPTAGGTSGSGFEIFGCRTGPSIPGACGIWRLHPTFRCPVFSSRGRRLALRACGWRRPNDAGAGGGLIAWLPAAGGPSSAAAAAAGSAGAAYDPTAPSAEAPSSMMEECEMLGQYERSAALAVFHGDLRAAVAALQRGVEALHGDAAGPTAPLGSAAANAAAALRAAAAATAASASETGLWRDMCESLLRRPAMQGAGPVAYLRASCAFLAAAPEAARAAAASLEAAAYSQSSPATPQSAVGMPLDTPSPASPPAGADLLAEAAPFRTQGGHGSPSFYSRVLQDAAISLADRLALACLYLPRDQLAAFVDREAEGCVATGDLEGVLVTGLGAHGVMLLQAYVDRTGDVQTAALVTARLPPAGTATRRDERPKERTCCEWLETYRELLNTWQLWHSRALLDVGRAELRAEQSRRAADPGGTSADGRRSSWESPELPEDVDRTTLPHLYVRCNFCNHGLPLSALRRQGGMGSSWLSRQKPVLTGCPACRKPLPKCYICLLPMGCLNPYLEIRRQQHKMKQQKAQQQQSGALSVGGGSAGGLGPGGVATGGGEPADALAELASIQFAEWFTWCQRCKHGGHAHHLADWFETHDECGISGCDCRCYCNDRPIVGGAALT